MIDAVFMILCDLTKMHINMVKLKHVATCLQAGNYIKSMKAHLERNFFFVDFLYHLL